MVAVQSPEANQKFVQIAEVLEQLEDNKDFLLLKILVKDVVEVVKLINLLVMNVKAVVKLIRIEL